MAETIGALIEAHAGEAKTIGAADRDWLTFGRLRDLTARTLSSLNALGIGPGDRVAIVLPNGPEMAAAFITMAQGVTTAPLNPGYREDEYDFYITDLKAKALVVMADYDGPALPVAERHGVRVIQGRQAAIGSGHKLPLIGQLVTIRILAVLTVQRDPVARDNGLIGAGTRDGHRHVSYTHLPLPTNSPR